MQLQIRSADEPSMYKPSCTEELTASDNVLQVHTHSVWFPMARELMPSINVPPLEAVL